ncbi:MerR family transcriptional regulator [Actinosynnema pretiosum subsp. pretiosum]|uniref:Transcriptional regulator, MerR family n=2 Tax=Actinosynnema TaxID=40566 RepID=C6WI78_ACTMD|nr:MerR family transcriptional regulator [Actinosynnema mirum]ACU36121.1 transcriptional regulator, MerR family [Actinosynnema mirum DSM 43827]QUF06194.1 MerR family transcriptional regulator [Actinosynnema pretiosum subsp. pretiosum]
MRIGELADKAGVSVRALRYYEEQGLLASVRSASGQRHYQEQAVERVLLIQQFYAAGLSSKAIQKLLPCILTGHITPQLMTFLATERDRITGQIDSLVQTRDRLDSMIDYTKGAKRCERPVSRTAG